MDKPMDKPEEKKSNGIFSDSELYTVKFDHVNRNLYEAMGTSRKECEKVWNDIINKAKKSESIGRLCTSVIIDKIWHYHAPLNVRLCLLYNVALRKGENDAGKSSATKFKVSGGTINDMPDDLKKMLREALEDENDN